MPHIELDEKIPGIRALFDFRPDTAMPLNQLAEVLLRGESTLERGERELIAAYVSRLNECNFCCWSHSAFAAKQLDGGYDVVDATLADLDSAPVSPKMRALLRLAGKVQESGRAVTDDVIAVARSEGATDREIHDTVLIAAAFCMFNRYVDGLAAVTPTDRAAYDQMAELIVSAGYAR
ncbi:MAG TPA: peroxidase-related enzyme [Acidimicrobiia bacterium]|nr:peroxidase-related enzyme [Acidimicrobiia bacterium]